mgnify:CR=1 FL=1
MLMAMEKIIDIDIDIYKKYKLFVWVILNDMYNLDIKAVCAKNARTGIVIKKCYSCIVILIHIPNQ